MMRAANRALRQADRSVQVSISYWPHQLTDAEPPRSLLALALAAPGDRMVTVAFVVADAAGLQSKLLFPEIAE